MKINTILLVLSLTAGSVVFAGSKAPRADRSQRVAEHLNLTEAQKEQFQQVMQSKHEKVKTAMASVHEEIMAEMASFLTDGQLKKLEEHQEKKHELRQHAREHKKMRRHASKH